MVIDALNECETSQATKFLNLLREITSELPVHVILSSLEDLDMKSLLHRPDVLTVSMSPEKSIEDMEYFVTCEIATAEDVYQNPLVKDSVLCTSLLWAAISLPRRL